MAPENLQRLAQRPLICPPAPAATIRGNAMIIQPAS